MKKILTTAILICFTLAIFSQTSIQGRVVDKLTREPLELAYVRHSNTSQGALTNRQDYVKWKETQFDTESRLKNEPAPVKEIHFTPGVPFFARIKMAIFF